MSCGVKSETLFFNSFKKSNYFCIRFEKVIMKNFLISLMLFVVPLVSMAQNENVNNGVLIPLQCDIVNGSIKK